MGSNFGQIFYLHFLETLTEVFVWGWYHRLASEIWKNESFEWFKSHYCINQYCNEHEFILDILEVNIRGRKLSNFRFEFGDFNSKLIHFFGFSQTGSDHFFAEFLEKSWYYEFGLKDTLTIFNFCHNQKYQFQNTIIISKLLSKPKMTTASLIKKIRIRTQFRKSHGIQKDCYILNLKKIWQTFKMTVISLICNFSEMNSFCLWVTAKKWQDIDDKSGC